MKFDLAARSLRATVIAGITAVSLSTTLAVTLAASFGGAVYTTDSAGAAVNNNTFNGAGAVYLNGGLNVLDGSSLPPNEIFYFEVTNPSGKILLSKDRAACRQVMTNSSGRIASVVPDSTCPAGAHPVGTQDGFGGITLKLGPFEQTPNKGNEYKVILVRKNHPSVVVGADGKVLDYSMSIAKSSGFKVLNYTDDGGTVINTGTGLGQPGNTD
jgi:hypothetical protein